MNALLRSLVTSTASLSISSATNDRLSITITDLIGRQFLVQQQELQPGTNQVQLNLLSIPALTAATNQGNYVFLDNK